MEKKAKTHPPILSPRERVLWALSAGAAAAAFFAFDGKSPLSLAASLVGVTSLIFTARGSPLGQLLMVLFSVLYGVISYRAAYYGEMATYLGMTAPMALAALVSWLRHPSPQGRGRVQPGRLRPGEAPLALLLTVLVTAAFYYILGALGTANLFPSTLSVASSFLAAYLTCRRSPWFALAYAANDVVLIVLWSMQALTDRSALSVTVCFFLFLLNDLYGFCLWRKRSA